MTEITAIIHTKNEEKNIAQAIRSVAWADEILVVDMESSDDTVSIAEQLGARILSVSNANYVEPARAAGIRAASHPWIVYIDADELIPRALAQKLRELTENPTADAYMLPRANYMFGDLLAHTGWGADQDKQFRFFRRDALEMHPDIHRKPSLMPGKKMTALTEKDVPPIVHFNYVDVNHFLTKLIRYTDIEAKAMSPGAPSTFRMLTVAMREFVLRYFALQGFRDGWQGFYLSLLMVTYRTTALAKAAGTAEENALGSIETRYRKIADEVLREYAPSKLNVQAPVSPEVDLIVNCFERTYREVLTPGFIRHIVEQNNYPFRKVTLLLNNIDQPHDAKRLAQHLLGTQEITQFFFVADHLDRALEITGLTRKKLGQLPFYSDWALVALIVPGSDWIVHWDADVHLEQPVDWITPSLQFIRKNPSVAVANPMWKLGDFRREVRSRNGDFILSYGFSDQVFLLRRSEFANPIYRFWLPISMRYPVSHIGPYFEQWVDAYLRVRKRLRATYLPATYVHATEEGSAYPRAWHVRWKNTLWRVLVAAMRRLPLRHPFLSD